MRKNRWFRFFVFALILSALYLTGFALAYFKIVSSQIYLSASFGFRASERPEIYGLIFTAELLVPVIGLFLGYLLIAFLVSKSILFSAVGVLLLMAGGYFLVDGILGISGKKMWETASMIGVGIFFIAIGVLLFKANSIFSEKKKTG